MSIAWAVLLLGQIAPSPTSSTAVTPLTGCPWGQAFAVGFEHRQGSDASEYAAVRDDDACEKMWLDLHHGKTMRLVERALDERPAEAMELRFSGEGLRLYVEHHRYRFLAYRSSWPRPGIEEVIGRASTYRRVCEGECTARLGKGRHYIALSDGDSVLAEIVQPLDLEHPLTIHARMESFETERTIGAWMVIGGLLGTLAGAIWVLPSVADRDGPSPGPAVAVGASLSSVIAGAVLLVWRLNDEVAVDFQR